MTGRSNCLSSTSKFLTIKSFFIVASLFSLISLFYSHREVVFSFHTTPWKKRTKKCTARLNTNATQARKTKFERLSRDSANRNYLARNCAGLASRDNVQDWQTKMRDKRARTSQRRLCLTFNGAERGIGQQFGFYLWDSAFLAWVSI